MSMMRIAICFVTLTMCGFCLPAYGVLHVFDADIYDDGADISAAFTDVSLSAIGAGRFADIDGRVYSRIPMEDGHASTGTKLFGNSSLDTDNHGNPSNETWYDGDAGYHRLRADFDNLADYVSIDVIGNNGNDKAIMEAYNSAGILLTSSITPVLVDGDIYALSIVRNSFDIAYIVCSGYRGDSVCLDNLHANLIPEPATLLLLSIGSLALLRRQRT